MIETHKHKCDKCGFVWEHANDCNGDTESHLCPKCGHEERHWYGGPDEAALCNGLDCAAPPMLTPELKLGKYFQDLIG